MADQKIPRCTCNYGPRISLEGHARWCEFRDFYEAKEEREHWIDEEAKERRVERRYQSHDV